MAQNISTRASWGESDMAFLFLSYVTQTISCWDTLGGLPCPQGFPLSLIRADPRLRPNGHVWGPGLPFSWAELTDKTEDT